MCVLFRVSLYEDVLHAQKTLIILPREEVIQRLRARREPITLFGETDLLRAERLRKLELKEPMEYIEGVESIFNQTIREGSDDEEEASLLAKLMEQDPDFVIEDREPKNDQERVLFWCRVSIDSLFNFSIFIFCSGYFL